MKTEDLAPDLAPGYPSKGKILGPTWQRTWQRLAGGGWLDGVHLAEQIGKDGTVAVKTVRELLNLAGRNGVLERTEVFDVISRRWHTHYRRPQ